MGGLVLAAGASFVVVGVGVAMHVLPERLEREEDR
jgi:hypothetical protein